MGRRRKDFTLLTPPSGPKASAPSERANPLSFIAPAEPEPPATPEEAESLAAWEEEAVEVKPSKPVTRAGKKVSDPLASVEWIYDNIDTQGLQKEDAPSPGDWSYLRRLQAHPTLLIDFYKSVWTKTLPSKSQIEAGYIDKDKGKSALELIGQLQQATGKPPEEEEDDPKKIVVTDDSI